MKKPQPETTSRDAVLHVPVDHYNYQRDLLCYYKYWFERALDACKECSNHDAHGQPLNKAAEIVDVFFADPNIDPRNTP